MRACVSFVFSFIENSYLLVLTVDRRSGRIRFGLGCCFFSFSPLSNIYTNERLNDWLKLALSLSLSLYNNTCYIRGVFVSKLPSYKRNVLYKLGKTNTNGLHTFFNSCSGMSDDLVEVVVHRVNCETHACKER